MADTTLNTTVTYIPSLTPSEREDPAGQPPHQDLSLCHAKEIQVALPLTSHRINDGASKHVEQSTLLEPNNNATALVTDSLMEYSNTTKRKSGRCRPS